MTVPRRWWLLAAAVSAASTWVRADAYNDFFAAVERNDDRTVRRLLAQGFDPNTPDKRGQPALTLAVREDAMGVVDALLATPELKVDAANSANETALMMAALHGRVEAVRKLLAAGAQVQREGWTPLHYAASGPEPALLTVLLERGAAIDAPSPNRSTPLMMAAGYGAIDGATLLLAKGANPRLRNDAGMGAADFARRAGRDRLLSAIEAALASRR